MKKIPEKYKRCGIRLQCLNCRSEVTDTCHEKGSSIATCKQQEKHRFKFVVHIPKTSHGKCTMLSNCETISEALVEMEIYKKALKQTNYCNEEAKKIISGSLSTEPIQADSDPNPLLPAEPQTKTESEIETTPFPPVRTSEDSATKLLLVDYANKYLKFITGEEVPIHLKRNYTKDHVSEITRVMERFCVSLDKAGYDVNSISLPDIKQTEIGLFCGYVQSLGIKSYNKHCAIVKAFYNWCIEIKDCEVKNPFNKMTLAVRKKSKTAIEQHEFQKLLNVITYENGHATLNNGKPINYYYDWLGIAFRLFLETGGRGEEVVNLNFNQIVELHKGVKAFKLVNLKVWRIKTGGDEERIDEFVKYIPITASLNRLLLECGLLSYAGTDRHIIPFASDLRPSYVQDIISRAFTHYIKSVTDRKIELKDLRKTYITRLSEVLGNKTKLFTGHADDAVLERHYLADEALMSGLTHINIFEDCA